MDNSSASPAATRRLITRKRLAIGFATTVLAVALFGLLGYYWLPGYVKNKIETILSEQLNRSVTIQAIDIQPYTLEFTVLGFRIAEKTDTDHLLFAFDRLYVDLSIESIRHLAPVVNRVSLTAPKLRLIREDKQRFNISDLIEQFKSQPDEPVKDAQRKQLFSVSNISIRGGAVEFEDRLKKSHQNIDEIDLDIPFIANFESAHIIWVEPFLSARINGAPFALESKLRPFADERKAELSLTLNDIDLTDIDEYSPIPLGIHLLSGKLDSDLSLIFIQAADETPSIRLSGRATLKELSVENKAVKAPHQVTLQQLDMTLQEAVLTEPKPVQVAVTLANAVITRHGEAKPAISLPKLNIDTITVDRAQRHIELSSITLDEANAQIHRQADGELDLAQLFAPVALTANNAPDATLTPASEPTQAFVSVIPIPGNKPANLTHDPDKLEAVSTLSTITAIPIPDHKPAATAESGIAETGADQRTAATELPSPEHIETGKAWTVHIDQVTLSSASLRFEDNTLAKVVPMNIESLDLVVEDIDLSEKKLQHLTLHANVNQRGSIEAKGALAWAPLTVNLGFDIKQVDLVPLQGWGGEQWNALLSQGDLSFQGNAEANGEPLIITLNGKGQLSNFKIRDKTARATELLRWKSIDLTGIQFVNEPLRVAIASVDLVDFYARVTLLPSKQLNLHYLVHQEDVASGPAPTSTNSVSQPAPVDASPPTPLPVYIDKVVLRNGHVNFADQFIKPNYRANLTGLKGQIGPLHPGKSGKIDLRGSFDRSAPLHITGTIDPFSGELFLDIMSTVTGINLPTFSPYSGRYLGYVIEKGKLSFDVNYHVEKGELTAKNNIFLDQLDLGAAVESPDAASLPIKLAISLLKNRRGEIDIRLPLSGSINDPKFSIGGILWEAFVNLITKAITAPFALLGSLLGDGEELSEISFPAGYTTLQPEAEKRLQVLAEALIDRPALKLEITGFADPVNDHDELKRALLARKIKTQKLTERVKKGEAVGSLEEITLDDEEYERYLTRVYKDADFEKPKNFIGLTKSLPVDEMEQLILANTPIGDNELHELAEHRASTVLHWLIEQGNIPSERVFVLGTKVAPASAGDPANSRVVFSLQ